MQWTHTLTSKIFCAQEEGKKREDFDQFQFYFNNNSLINIQIHVGFVT